MTDARSSPDADTNDSTAPTRVRGGRLPLLLALGAFLLSLGVTFAVWQAATDDLARSTRSEFDYEVRQSVRRIEERMATYEQAQRGTQAFLLGSMDVKRDDFKLFVASLRLAQTFPGIQGIALVRLVPPSQLASHTAAIRAEGLDYQIKPAGEREVYSAITHIEPYSGMNLRALGFDMLSDPTRRAAMERARDTGLAAASGKLRLIQESGRDPQSGLVMYLPVYRRGAATATLEQRRAALIGWVGAPFRMGDMMTGLDGERDGDMLVSIYDGGEVDPDNLMYASPVSATEAAHRSLFRENAKITVGGRPWALTLRSSPMFESRLESDKPRMIAALGVAASGVLGLFVWTLASGRRRALVVANRATHQLSESEFRWQYALEGAGDGVWDWNRATGESLYSRRWKEMLGYREDEIGDSPEQWERLLHPDDAERVFATLDAYANSTSEPYEAEYRMRCKDGSWRWIRGRGMAVTRDAAGLPLRTIGTHTDITRLKEDENTLRLTNASLASEQQRVRVILENSHDAFIAVAPDGRVTDWSAKAEKLLGWSAGEAVGSDLAGLIVPPQFRAMHNAGFRRFVDSGQGTLLRDVIEVNAMHRDGSLIPVELAIAGFQTPSGYAVSAFIRDISERKVAQRLEVERAQALDEARNALQHSQRLEAVGKLTGGIAHDFNNVLHIIGGNVQLMQLMSAGDERLQQRLKSMQLAVDRGAKLSSQLLSFARRQPLQPVVVNLARTLQNMDDLLQRAIGESVHIVLEASQQLWNTQVDPGQLENVILNLAINARDAMPEGGTLTVGLQNATVGAENVRRMVDMPPGDYVRLSLSDTGSGMSDEVKAVAFEPFFTTKPVGQGTGLGLSMAYGFVKQSGGHIQINSVLGEGTTVVIHLPRSTLEEAQSRPPQAEPTEGGSETILVVEDDPEVRFTAVQILSELGYQVLEAEDGESALRTIRAGVRIDLLFSDVVMPGPVSSTELAALAKQILPSMGVLFASGYTRNALVTDGKLDKGVQLLGKPYGVNQLAKKVREVLGLRRV